MREAITYAARPGGAEPAACWTLQRKSKQSEKHPMHSYLHIFICRSLTPLFISPQEARAVRRAAPQNTIPGLCVFDLNVESFLAPSFSYLHAGRA